MKITQALIVSLLLASTQGMRLTKANLAQRVSEETSDTIKNAVADVLKITQEVEPFENPVSVS